MPSRSFIAARYSIVALAASVGLLVTIGASLAVAHWERRLAELQFAELAKADLQTIDTDLHEATNLLHTLQVYVETADHPITRTEYQAFALALRADQMGVRDTGWAPYVTEADRPDFERAAQAHGFDGFRIWERDAAGKPISAASQPDHIPILYPDPVEVTSQVQGFDLLSENWHREAITRARATGHAAATPPLELITVRQPVAGFMEFQPVHAGQSHATPNGIVFGVFEIAPMIEKILRSRPVLAPADLYLFNPAAQGAKRLIYWHSSLLRRSPALVPQEAAVLAGPHWTGTFEVGGQPWGAAFIPINGMGGGVLSWRPLITLAGGLTLTTLLVLYLLASIRRTRQLELLTTSLQAKTDELRLQGERVAHMARHDGLTDLPNRTAFRDAVDKALSDVRWRDRTAVLYLDLDRFKAVNDSLGHPVGDALLCIVADRLRSSVRNTDTPARLGGDEFAIVQIDANQPASAESLAQRLIDRLSAPYTIAGHEIDVGVSVGIALADSDAGDVDQLMLNADLALYGAKRDGRGVYRSFHPELEAVAREQHKFELYFRHALDRGEFDLHYQPVINIHDGRVTALEALLRWHHPERGMIVADDFMTLAEETGQIVPIGVWVIETALNEAAKWPEPVPVSINLSPRQLSAPGLVETIEATLAAVELPGERLELEITENALEGGDATLAVLARLRALGVRIVLDHFSLGYASFINLRRFAFDRVKIDRSLAQDPEFTAGDTTMVQAIVRLGHALGIVVSAAGIESSAQLESFRNVGCTEMQGHLFSVPQAASIVPFLFSDSATWREPLRAPAQPIQQMLACSA